MNNMCKKFIVYTTMMGLTGMLWANPAQALQFSGSSSGVFTNPTGPAGMNTTGVGTSSFTWGTPIGTPPSSLSFAGQGFSGDFETTEFAFGTLSYFNGTIAANTQADEVDLTTTLLFTLPSGVSQSFDFNFSLINTPNSGDPWASADSVTLGNAYDPTKFFSVGGVDYTLQFTRFGNVDANGQIVGINEFHVLENTSASAQLFGKLTAHPNAVPEPGTLLLLGSGMIGLIALRKRARRT